jgi:hypothetical protein
MRTPEDVERDEEMLQDRAFLRRFKRPIGARRAIGRKYFAAADLPRMGAAIEKRARKALKRKRDRERRSTTRTRTRT